MDVTEERNINCVKKYKREGEILASLKYINDKNTFKNKI